MFWFWTSTHETISHQFKLDQGLEFGKNGLVSTNKLFVKDSPFLPNSKLFWVQAVPKNFSDVIQTCYNLKKWGLSYIFERTLIEDSKIRKTFLMQKSRSPPYLRFLDAVSLYLREFYRRVEISLENAFRIYNLFVKILSKLSNFIFLAI